VNCTEGRSTADEIAGAKEKFGITDEAILFMGLYGYPPNMEAVRFLTQQVMPELYRRRPDARLVVTGGGPSLNVPWMINAGIVPRQELNALLGACRIGVAPIFKGSGTRLKILEYMAAGLPVVSTRKGAEGLNLEEGKHVLYAETGAEFQSALLSLLSDRPLSQHLSDCAAELVRSEFDWAPLLDRFGSQLGAG
jgi:glycosyltransferase involved in cell wall biosynthesis